MYAFLSGVVATLAIVIAACFARSYAMRRDRLFAYFTTAFALFGTTAVAMGIRDRPEIDEPLAYLPRLAVFAIILLAIFEKNRQQAVARRQPDKRAPGRVVALGDRRPRLPRENRFGDRGTASRSR